jgi:hypothetical protein
MVVGRYWEMNVLTGRRLHWEWGPSSARHFGSFISPWERKKIASNTAQQWFFFFFFFHSLPHPTAKGMEDSPRGGGCISHHPDLLLYPPTCGKWGAAGGWKRKRRGTPKSSWAQWESSEQEGKWQSTTACHDKRTTTTTTTRFFFLLFNELCTEKWS